jgi:hypothetical protein
VVVMPAEAVSASAPSHPCEQSASRTARGE